ncbi:T6SS immunity protein Tli3 family protein, partial [Citrobacter youngae]
MKKGSALKIIIGAFSLCAIAACTKKIPSQVIYRFDDNRYLELIGYDCEGYVVYHDIKRKIHKSIYGNPIYRVFSGEFIHPSEQYVLVPEWEP